MLLAWVTESAAERCSITKGALKNFAKFTGKHLCQSPLFNNVPGLRPAILLKKETSTQVFSCEFCEMFKKPFFTEHLPAAASVRTFLYLVVGEGSNSKFCEKKPSGSSSFNYYKRMIYKQPPYFKKYW